MQIFFLSLLTFVASFIGTLAGFGSSTIMLPIMLIFYPLPESLLFVGIVHFFNDLWEVTLYKHALNWRVFIYFGLPGVVASVVGANLVFIPFQETLSKTLGVFLVLYVLFLIFNKKFKIKKTFTSTIFGGVFSGFIAGIFGIGGPIRSIFLTSLRLSKETYLVTAGAVAILVDSSRLITYYLKGAGISALLTYGLFIFVPVSFFSAQLAKGYINKVSQKTFRLIISILLFIVGVSLVIS